MWKKKNKKNHTRSYPRPPRWGEASHSMMGAIKYASCECGRTTMCRRCFRMKKLSQSMQSAFIRLDWRHCPNYVAG